MKFFNRRKINLEKTIYPVLLIVIVSVIFGSGYMLGKSRKPAILDIEGVVNKESGKPDQVDFDIFWRVWKTVEERYINRDIDRQDMVYGAVSGLVRSLGDPYSVFMPPAESKRFMEDVDSVFEGIGAEIGIRNDVLTVISPLKNSPAETAGLRSGDKIIKIDDAVSIDLSLDQAVSLIRGPRGSVVSLTVARDGLNSTLVIDVTRDTIKVPTVEWEFKENNIAYVQIYHFSEKTSVEFKKAVQEILSSSSDKIILDLRGNPGGYLGTAVDILGWFVDNGEVVVKEFYGDGDKRNKNHTATGNAALKNFKTVILINGGSASASEIVAGALKDINGVKLIGQKTFGKGSIQELIDFTDGSSVKLTIAKWLTPSGISIADNGIAPDYEIEMTNDDIDNKKDPQLDEAFRILNE